MPDNTSTIKGLEQDRAKSAYLNAEFAMKGWQKHLENKFFKKEDSEQVKQAKRLEITRFISDKTPGALLTKEKLEEAVEKFGKEYKSYAKKLPMMIKTNGLGAAVTFAFSKAKDGNAWELLYNHVSDWLKQPHKVFLLGTHASKPLTEAIISLPSTEYRAVTVEVLAFMNWLRRFAEGLIEGEAEEES
jgi:CRISPR-associated protein Cmr5